MTTYEKLLEETDKEKITIKEKRFHCSANGLVKDNKILINKDLITSAKACALAEELGHFHTTAGDILDQSHSNNSKQELRARVWAYNKLVGLAGIVKAYHHHCCDIHDMADYLDVTEEFLQDSLASYKDKYGICTMLDHYVIYFEPNVCVLEMI